MTDKEEKEDKNIDYPVIMIIDAYDHYSSNYINNKKACVVRFVGEWIKDDDNYYYLRHVKADLNDKESAEEIHIVMKDAIVRKERIDVTLKKIE